MFSFYETNELNLRSIHLMGKLSSVMVVMPMTLLPRILHALVSRTQFFLLNHEYVNLAASTHNLFSQGVHTMLPISWPVSVVLAVLLSIIHLSYRIASNFENFPTLFMEQVNAMHRT